MDADLKREVEAIYAELGMNLTSAVNAFLRQSVRVGGMPFDLRLNEQQRETVLVMVEAEQLASDPAVEALNVEDALAELKR
jgi:addiction module antitoxin, relB/dinJ family